MKYSPGKLNYIKGLDGIRGLAVLLVVVFHVELIHKMLLPEGEFNLSGFDRLFIQIFELGWIGVDLFFVLSGFLITRILLLNRDKKNVFKTFYWRRFLRILPLYYLILVAYFILMPLTGLDSRPGTFFQVYQDNQSYFWLHISNFLRVGGKLPAGDLLHFWSLAVEEQYYLFIPFIIVVLPVKTSRFTLILGIVGSMLFRYYNVMIANAPEINTYAHPLARMEAFMWGGLLAYFLEFSPVSRIYSIRKYVKLSMLAISLVIFYFLYTGGQFQTQKAMNPTFSGFFPLIQTFGYGFISLFFTLSIFLHLTNQREKTSLLESNFLCLLGKYSYFIYLTHTFIIGGAILAGLHFPRISYHFGGLGYFSFTLFTLFIVLISIIMGHFSFTLLESPLLRYKSKASYE
jgi:peptidoglycan/LPS O-acetylase OafA/YrhL